MFDPRKQAGCDLRHAVGGFYQCGKLPLIQFGKGHDHWLKVGTHGGILRHWESRRTCDFGQLR